MTGYFRTAVLLAGMTALFLGVGYVLGGEQGMLVALLIAGATNLFAFWSSDRMVLAMHQAEPVSPESAPRLYAMVQQLAQRAGVPVPALYVIHEDQPNAFATGRSPENAAIAVNTGLLDMMSEEEVAGVLAHEMAHIAHRDTLLMTVTATLAGAISMLAQFGMMFGGRNTEGRRAVGPVGTLLLLVLGPLAAMLVQMAISRAREYEADRLGAELTGDPRWLANALLKLEQGARQIPNAGAEANPASAHLFIVNPLHGGLLAGLFRTHPATEDRVARLLAMIPGGGQGWGAPVQVPQGGPWGGGTRRNPWG